jgi:hypothetical protein
MRRDRVPSDAVVADKKGEIRTDVHACREVCPSAAGEVTKRAEKFAKNFHFPRVAAKCMNGTFFWLPLWPLADNKLREL